MYTKVILQTVETAVKKELKLQNIEEIDVLMTREKDKNFTYLKLVGNKKGEAPQKITHKKETDEIVDFFSKVAAIVPDCREIINVRITRVAQERRMSITYSTNFKKINTINL